MSGAANRARVGRDDSYNGQVEIERAANSATLAVEIDHLDLGTWYAVAEGPDVAGWKAGRVTVTLLDGQRAGETARATVHPVADTLELCGCDPFHAVDENVKPPLARAGTQRAGASRSGMPPASSRRNVSLKASTTR